MDTARFLTDHSHDVTLQGKATRRIQYDGGALHMAVQYQQKDMMLLILEHGGDPSSTSTGLTGIIVHGVN